MALTPANMLDEMIVQAVQQPVQMEPPPPRQYMTPGMGEYEMGMDGLPIVKGQPQQTPVPQVLPPPSQAVQQAAPPVQMSRRDDMNRRLK